MNALQKRQRIERKIIRSLINDGLDSGYTISVSNGEEPATEPMNSVGRIMKSMFATDEERLIFYMDGMRAGWVCLVYGNDGDDVVADYSVSMEPLVERRE